MQSARKIKSHELTRHLRRRLRRARWSWRCASATASSARRTTSRAATARSTTRTWACHNGIDLKRYATPRPRAHRRDDRLGRRRRPQGLARALGARAARGPARPARGALRVRRPPRRRRVRRGVRARARDRAAVRARSRSTRRRCRCSTSRSRRRRRTTCSAARATCAGSRRARSACRSSRTPTSTREIEDGVTGVHARTPGRGRGRAAALVDDAELRERIGASAHDYVAEHRSIQVAAERWRDVLLEVAREGPGGRRLTRPRVPYRISRTCRSPGSASGPLWGRGASGARWRACPLHTPPRDGSRRAASFEAARLH